MTGTNESLIRILESVNAVPDSERCFGVSADVATRQYGISLEVLDRLLVLGMAVKRHDNELYFDAYDLANLSLHMGFSSIQRLAMRSWSKTLRVCEAKDDLTATIQILPVEAPQSEFQVTLVLQDIRATGAILHLLKGFAQFNFYMLPEACRWNVDFITINNICECGGASKLLTMRARDQGLEARQCFGLLVAEPFSTGHYWTEFLIDDKWVAFDPLLIGLLQMVTKLPASNWPTHRSNGFALNRLCVIEDYDEAGAPILSALRGETGIVPLDMIMAGQTQVVSLPTVLSSCTVSKV